MGKKLPTTFRRKMIGCNLLIIICIAASISLYNYSSYKKDVIHNETAGAMGRISSMSARLAVACDEMINIVQNCADRKSLFLASSFNGYGPDAGKATSLYAANVLKDFCAISGYSQYIYKITVYSKGSPLLQAGTFYGSTDDVERILQAPWFKDHLNRDSGEYRLTLEQNPFPLGRSAEPLFLPLVRPLSYAKQEDLEDAWVFLAISPELFQDALDQMPEDNKLMILTRDGQMAAGQNGSADSRAMAKLLDGQAEPTGSLRTTLDGLDSVVVWEKLTVSGLTVCEVLPIGDMPLDQSVIKSTVGIVFIFCLVIGSLLSLLFTRYLSAPISRLTRRLDRISAGDFTPDATIESHDEIGMIGRQINEMSGHISELVETRIQSEKEKKDLEIKMLQAQINPHFLYNTLDSIKWIATMQHNQGIVQVVTALSALLKNMAKGFNEKVTLRQELDFLDNYVTIEKIRYIELFDMEIQVDEPELYQASIIKLTLQPIVENAIFSGIEPSGNPGLIKIHVYSAQGVLFITITDNGVGISPEGIEKLLSDTARVGKNYMSGIGLPNVDRRLKLVYGEDYGLSIASTEGLFTTVTISLPLEYPGDGPGKENFDVPDRIG